MKFLDNPLKYAGNEYFAEMLNSLPRVFRMAIISKMPGQIKKKKNALLPSKNKEIMYDKIYDYLTENKDSNDITNELLYQWFLMLKKNLLCDALEYLDIKHDENGIITDDEYNQKDFDFRKYNKQLIMGLVDHLLGKSYDKKDIAIYLAYNNAVEFKDILFKESTN